MDTSPNLLLPYIAAAQSQKHVTHNEAIRALDALVQLAVLDKDLATPPASPADGARYIIGASPTGAWLGRATQIAASQDGAWSFYPPRLGWMAFVADEGLIYRFDGTAWVGAVTGISDPTPKLGINTASDTTNRLAVASPATLLTHAGAGHQLKINKSAASATGSLLLQTAFSGRAEIGLAGDDDLRVKVSADGTTWRDAIIVDRTTGSVSMPLTTLSGGGGTNPNLLVNGDLQINQRAFAGGSLAAGLYGFDRWKAGAAGASLSISGTVLTLASGAIQQVIEPSQWGFTSLASTQITLSVESLSADLAVTIGSATGTITAGTGRRSVTLTTAAGDTGNIVVQIARATAGSVAFARVKAETGAAATAWQARPAAHELRLCQRYCQTSYPQGIAPGSANAAIPIAIHSQCIVANASWSAGIRFPVQLRASPTFQFWSRSGTASRGSSFNTGAELALTPNSVTSVGVWWFAGTGLTVGDFVDVAWLATAEL